MPAPLKMSDAGRAMTRHFEGCVLRTYLDVCGVPTIGYGTTGPHIMPGLVITQQQAELWLIARQDAITANLSQSLPEQTPQGQIDALTDFAYNVGEHALLTSTLFLRTRAGQVDAAAEQFGQWIHGRDHEGREIVLPGLVRRRAAEAQMFKTGRWTPAAV